ncbi:MAG: GNAT family N-acetyltransferase [Bacteroidales bacterium]
MIRYLKQSEIDYQKWDECINKSTNKLIYAYSWYLDIVANQWDAIVEGDYTSVMPLPYKKKFFIYKVYQPFFTQQLGIFSQKLISENMVKDFLNAIPGKFLFLDVSLNSSNPFADKKSYKIEEKRTYLLDLINPYEILKKAYSENNKRNIKKAQKNKLYIKEHDNFDEIINTFKANKGQHFPEIRPYHYRILRQLLFTCLSKGLCLVVNAYNEHNTFCAGIVFVISGERLIFLFSGATPESRNNGAMFYLVDHVIRKYQGTENVIDFEGSMDENLARFYRGFGSKECLYLRLKKTKLKLF